MAEQYQKLVNKQYNSPINLYSDRNVREILERETKVLANGAIGIDFNNPTINKPSNLQNSAVLRMLEEEENRKRSGQPGSIEKSTKPLRDQIVWPPEPNVKRHTTLKDVTIPSGLKRVAWPPPNSELDEFIEQEAIHSQGGPLYSTSINTSGLQNYQTPSVQSQPQKPLSSPVVAQRQQQQQDQLLYQQQQLPKSSVTNTNSFQPTISPVTSVKSPQSVSQSSVGQSPFQSAPISPNVSKSPVSFTNLAKPWSLQNQSTPHFKPVQPPSLRTIQSYQQQQQSSEQYHYSQQHYQQEQTRETQTIILPSVYQTQETTFQQYQSPLIVETQQSPLTFEVIKSHQGQEQQQPQEFTPQKQAFDLNQNKIETPKNVFSPPSFQSSTSIEVQQEVEPSKPFDQIIPESPKPVAAPPSLKTVTPIQKVIPPKQTQSVSVDNKGAPQNQAPAPQRYQLPVKQVEPPPSTITLRPQAPVSQAPPPLVTSQPATATLRGGKNLRGDLKWPPENVRERMAAEEQHLIELSHGPAVRPRKNCKDYSSFFAKHALTHAYPGYKIPPGTQFYDHNPVM